MQSLSSGPSAGEGRMEYSELNSLTYQKRRGGAEGLGGWEGSSICNGHWTFSHCSQGPLRSGRWETEGFLRKLGFSGAG